MSSDLLPADFYARDALEVARDLLGMHIRRGPVALRITEVEAYRWPDDSANHCRAGRTARNAAMWGAPGHTYVYLCYGLHQMLNLVTNREGEGAAVLIRACEPVEGHEVVQERRNGLTGPNQLTGPGRVGAALALGPSFNRHPVFRSGDLEVRRGAPVRHVLEGPRIGIGYAAPEHQSAPWRLADEASAYVARKRDMVRVRSG